MDCDCSEECEGVVAVYHVYGNGHDWGLFNYCEKAVEEDLRRGFYVEPVNQQDGD